MSLRLVPAYGPPPSGLSDGSLRCRPALRSDGMAYREHAPVAQATRQAHSPACPALSPGERRAIRRSPSTRRSTRPRSASGKPQAEPRIAQPMAPAASTAAAAAMTAASCARLAARSPKSAETTTPAVSTKITNITAWRNHARGSVRMWGFRKRTEPCLPTIDASVSNTTAAKPRRTNRPTGPVRKPGLSAELI